MTAFLPMQRPINQNLDQLAVRKAIRSRMSNTGAGARFWTSDLLFALELINTALWRIG